MAMLYFKGKGKPLEYFKSGHAHLGCYMEGKKGSEKTS